MSLATLPNLHTIWKSIVGIGGREFRLRSLVQNTNNYRTISSFTMANHGTNSSFNKELSDQEEITIRDYFTSMLLNSEQQAVGKIENFTFSTLPLTHLATKAIHSKFISSPFVQPPNLPRKSPSRSDINLLNMLNQMVLLHSSPQSPPLNQAPSFPYSSPLLAPLYRDPVFVCMLLNITIKQIQNFRWNTPQQKTAKLLYQILWNKLKHGVSNSATSTIILTTLIRFSLKARETSNISNFVKSLLYQIIPRNSTKEIFCIDSPLLNSLLAILLHDKEWQLSLEVIDFIFHLPNGKIKLDAGVLNLFLRYFLEASKSIQQRDKSFSQLFSYFGIASKGKNTTGMFDFGTAHVHSLGANTCFMSSFLTYMLTFPLEWFKKFKVEPNKSSQALANSILAVYNRPLVYSECLHMKMSSFIDRATFLKYLIELEKFNAFKVYYRFFMSSSSLSNLPDARFFETLISQILLKQAQIVGIHRRQIDLVDHEFIFEIFNDMTVVFHHPPSSRLLSKLIHHILWFPTQSITKKYLSSKPFIWEKKMPYIINYLRPLLTPTFSSIQPYEITTVLRAVSKACKHNSAFPTLWISFLHPPLPHQSFPFPVCHPFYDLLSQLLQHYPTSFHRAQFETVISSILIIEKKQSTAVRYCAFVFHYLIRHSYPDFNSTDVLTRPQLRVILLSHTGKFGSNLCTRFFEACKHSVAIRK